MPLERAFIRYFTDSDLIDVGFRREQGRIVDFRLNYRARIEGGWHEVVRYDTAHAQPLHIHRYWVPHRGQKDFLEDMRRDDYGVALDEALRDLEDNWQRYRHHVERDIGRRPPEE